MNGDLLFVTEGFPDAVTAWVLGFPVIGLPSASTCIDLMADHVKVAAPAKVIITADRDEAGERSALKAAGRLLVDGVEDVRIITPPAPHKDLNDWLMAGASRDDVGDLIDRTEPFEERDHINSEANESGAISQEKRQNPPAEASDNRSGTETGHETGTELWFAHRLVKDHGEDLRWIDPWRKWLTWTGRRWKQDDTGEAIRRAENVAQDLLEAATGKIDRAIEKKDKDALEAAEAELKTARRFWERRPLENGLVLAHSSLAAIPDQWDRDPWLLNVENGTVDLKTGELKPHCREDLITKLAPTAWNREAQAPRFDRFLSRILPDVAVREYIQRALGYSVSGEIREHALHVAWGAGANGKTTLFDTVAYVVGDYSGIAPATLFMLTKGDRHPTEIAALFGKRLVTASETPEGGRLNENLIKTLTGGDMITARRMREDFWTFAPTHTLWISTNHKPRVYGTDLGIWRRLRLIPFTVTIPEEEQDPDLPRKLRDEGPGILVWLVEGCWKYLREGLNPPEAVRVATDEYRSGEDVLGEFLEDRVGVTRSDMDRVSTREIYKAFEDWAEDQGIKPWAQRTLTVRLKDRGLEYINSHGFRGFLRVHLGSHKPDFPVNSPYAGAYRGHTENSAQASPSAPEPPHLPLDDPDQPP